MSNSSVDILLLNLLQTLSVTLMSHLQAVSQYQYSFTDIMQLTLLQTDSKLIVPQCGHTSCRQCWLNASSVSVQAILPLVSQCRVSSWQWVIQFWLTCRQCLNADYPADSVLVLTHLQTVIVTVLTHTFRQCLGAGSLNGWVVHCWSLHVRGVAGSNPGKIWLIMPGQNLMKSLLT